MTAPAKAHNKYSASSAHRWMVCGGSIALSVKAPPQKESPYATEGTKAHEVFEAFLKNEHKQLATAAKFVKTHGPQMVMHAEIAAKWVQKTRPKGAQVFAERKVQLPIIHADLGGTLDCAIVEEFGRLWIIDYKYGAGVAVDPEWNEQLLVYALAVAYEYDFNFLDVELVIIQPRAEHSKGPIRSWSLSIEQLKEWGEKLASAVALAESGQAELVPDATNCRWCPAKIICPAISTSALKQAQVEFGGDVVGPTTLKLPGPTTLEPKKLGEALVAFELIENWMEAVRDHAAALLEAGTKVPGFKLVQKRSIRKWIDIDVATKEAKKKFGEKAFDVELKSPAQLEKVIDPNWVAKHCSDVSSGVTLVKETDKRPAVNSAQLDFNDPKTKK